MRRGTDLYRMVELLRRVGQKSQTHTPHRLVGRGVDGVEVLQDLEKACPVRGDLGTQEQGAVSLSPTTSRARGVTGVGSLTTAQGGVMRLERQTPYALERGGTHQVTCHGLALPPSLAFDYLDPSEGEVGPLGGHPLHPHVKVLSSERLGGTSYRLEVQVGEGAPLVDGAPLAWGRGEGGDPLDTGESALPHRAERFYAIVPPNLPPAFVSYAYDGADVIAGQYAADGTPLAPLGRASRSEWDPLWASPIWGSPQVGDGALAIADGGQVEVIDWADDITHSTSDFEGSAASVAYIDGDLYFVALDSGSGFTATARLYRSTPTLGDVELLATGNHVAPALSWGGPAWVAWRSDRVHIARIYTTASGQSATVLTFYLGGPATFTDTTSFQIVGTGWPSDLGPMRGDQQLETGGEDGVVWVHWPSGTWPDPGTGVYVTGGPDPSGDKACLVRGGRLLAGRVVSGPTLDVPLGESPDWPWPDLIFPMEGAV